MAKKCRPKNTAKATTPTPKTQPIQPDKFGAFTTIEHEAIQKHFEGQLATVSDQEFVRMEAFFELLKYPEFKTPASDMKEVYKMLPGIDRDAVKGNRIKALEGACQCGRERTCAI